MRTSNIKTASRDFIEHSSTIDFPSRLIFHRRSRFYSIGAAMSVAAANNRATISIELVAKITKTHFGLLDQINRRLNRHRPAALSGMTGSQPL